MLKVREDWLNTFVGVNSDWKLIIDKLIESNAFVAIPASKGWYHGDCDADSVLLIEERGVKGPPPAFQLVNEKLECVNYPGSFKPMTVDEFIQYAASCTAAWQTDNDWLTKLLSQEE